jgi:hypothetical protein
LVFFFFSLLTSEHEFLLCIVGFPWGSRLMLNGKGGMAFVTGRYCFPSGWQLYYWLYCVGKIHSKSF